MSDTRRLLFGTDEPRPPERWLQAGPLTLCLRGIRLLALSAGGHEIWHGVAFLHRDADWGTAEPVVDEIEDWPVAAGFRLRIRAHVPVEPRIDLRIELDGDDAGCVRYEGVATPRGDIETNRTGLCLMHPLSAIERPVEVVHDDGRLSRSTFPRRIAPWPPFTAVRVIRHEVADGLWASARFEGETFELEDQRNNADASFKTYGRSNFMPRPYRLRTGRPVRQAVELRLEGAVSDLAGPTARDVARARVTPAPAMPVGVGVAPADAARSAALRPWLRRLGPAHLHLGLQATPGACGAAVDWGAIRAMLDAAGARLRLGVTLAEERWGGVVLPELADVLRREGIVPESVVPFPSTPPVIDAARRAFPDAAIGGGTPHFFTQLNRLEDLGWVDQLVFRTSALVHGTDEDDILYGLHSLPWMMETLGATHPGMPVHVGPSGIGVRASPLGAQPASDGRRRLTLAEHDPRSRALFGAAWLLGYVASCRAAGVAGVGLSTLLGPSGLLREEGGRLRPCPAFHVLQTLRRGRSWRAAGGSRLVCEDAGLTLLANLSMRPADIDIDLGDGPDAGTARASSASPASASPRIELMDGIAWREFERGAAHRPWRRVRADATTLHLPPLAVARLRST